MSTTRHPPRPPLFETPASRLAELVHLLADVPLAEALDELPTGIDSPGSSHPDPLWVVAGALVRLRRSTSRRPGIHRSSAPTLVGSA